MAQLAVTVALGLGTRLLLSLFQPIQEGPRLDDLTTPKSQWGQQIPIVYGRMRVTGNVIWSTDIVERSTVSKGGKGMGGKQRTYSYFANFAVLLCEGPILGIGRIWLNNEVWYNVLDWADSSTRTKSFDYRNRFFRVYNGGNTQTADPLISSIMGAGNTPGYRGRAYIVFENLPLEEFGNRIPAVAAEIITAGTVNGNGSITPARVETEDIVTDICGRVGIESGDLDVSEIVPLSPITGFFISQAGPAKTAIQNLCQSQLIDTIDSGDKIKFLRKDRSVTPLIVDSADWAAQENSREARPKFSETRTDDLQLPREVAVTHIDPDLNYESGVQRAFKNYGNSDNVTTLTLQSVLTASEGATLANRLLWLAWNRRRSVAVSLPLKYLSLEAGDLISLNLHGEGERWQITRCTLGANLILEVEAQFFAPDGSGWSLPQSQTSTGSSVATSGNILGSPDQQQVRDEGYTTLEVLDINLALDTDSDVGLYFAVQGNQNWRGAALFASRDDLNYSQIGTFAGRSVIGQTSDALGNYTGNLAGLDTTSVVTVELTGHGTELESITLARLQAGENRALIGNEIVGFQTATLIGPGEYELTDFYRGRRGTEWAISGHSSSERFVLLTGYTVRLDSQPSEIGHTLYFKAPTRDQELDDIVETAITFDCNSAKPYAPVSLSGTRNQNNEATLAWVRRDRKRGEATTYTNLPLSEASEKYEIEILNGSTVVRTLNSNLPTVNYSRANQITDFGSPQTSLKFRVFQISDLVGRGYPAEATVTLTLVNQAPAITSFNPSQGDTGTTVTINGSNFTGATAVSFGGTAASSFTVVSDSQITATVGSGASGFIAVTGPGGTGVSQFAYIFGALGGGGGSDSVAIRRGWMGL